MSERIPPGLADALLRRCLPDAGRAESVRGDLHREFYEDAPDGALAAAFWYWRAVLALSARYLADPYLEKFIPARIAPPTRKVQPVDDLLQDVRFGARVFVRNRGLAAVAIVTLALGIGANTAVFSVLNAVLLRPLPYPQDERLVAVHTARLDGSPGGGNVAPFLLREWQSAASGFESMAAYDGRWWIVASGDGVVRVTGTRAAGPLFEVLGVEPLLGRWLTAQDDLDEAHRVVLSHGLWTSVFGADRGVVGRTMTLNDDAYEIVGVMPAGFGFPDADVQLYTPAAWSAEYRANQSNFAHRVVARLADGVSMDAAAQEMVAVSTALREQYAAILEGSTARVVPMRLELLGELDVATVTLPMAAVVVVLLIACVNLANLLMAQATARRQETAVRRALGASTLRLVRQSVTEALLLAFAGGVIGVALGANLIGVAMSLLPDDLPLRDNVALDGRVLLFTLLATIACGLAFGVLPGLRRSAAGSGELRSTRGATRLGAAWSGLVVAEVALSVLLLLAAGLLVRTFTNLTRVDPGFDASGLLTFSLQLRGVDQEAFEGVWQETMNELTSIPGVVSASASTRLPSSTVGISGWFNYADRPVDNADRRYLVPYRVVLPGYFETLRVPLRAGRSLQPGDGVEAPAAVINEAAVRQFWPDRDPLGERLTLGGRDGVAWFAPLTVVGVVGDVRNDGLQGNGEPAVYLLASVASPQSRMSVVVRTSGDPQGVVEATRQRLRRVVPGAPLFDVATVEQMYRGQIAPTRAMMILFGTLALLGVLMAGVGVFGVLSYAVGQRTRELGIRMALGARAASVIGLVARQVLAQVASGAVAGLIAAVALAPWLDGLLFEVALTDPATLAGAAAVLAAIAALATFFPARRATRVEPVTALRAD